MAGKMFNCICDCCCHCPYKNCQISRSRHHSHAWSSVIKRSKMAKKWLLFAPKCLIRAMNATNRTFCWLHQSNTPSPYVQGIVTLLHVHDHSWICPQLAFTVYALWKFLYDNITFICFQEAKRDVMAVIRMVVSILRYDTNLLLMIPTI